MRLPVALPALPLCTGIRPVLPDTSSCARASASSDCGRRRPPDCSLLGRSIDMSILTEFCKYSVVPVRTEHGELSLSTATVGAPVFPLPASVLCRWFKRRLAADHGRPPCWRRSGRSPWAGPPPRCCAPTGKAWGLGREGLLLALRPWQLGERRQDRRGQVSANPRAQQQVGASQKEARARRKRARRRTRRGQAATRELSVRRLAAGPSAWPVLSTRRPAGCGGGGGLSGEFASVPPSVRALLREGAKLAASGRGNGKGGEVRLRLMRGDVEETLLSGQLPRPAGVASAAPAVISLDGTDSDGEVAPSPSPAPSEAPELGPEVLEAAQHFAEVMRAAHPANVVTPEQACRALLALWAGAQARGQQPSWGKGQHWDKHGGGGRGQAGTSAPSALTASTRESCAELFSWAMAGGLSGAMSHLMATSGHATPLSIFEQPCFPGSPALPPAWGRVYGPTALADVIRVTGREASASWLATSPRGQVLPFRRHFAASSAKPAPGWPRAAFRSACGATARQVQPWPAALKLRSTQPSAVLSPLGLGAVNKKHVYEVDVALAEEWRLLLSRRMPAQTAQQLSGQSLRTCWPREAADPATPEAAHALRSSDEGSGRARGRPGPREDKGSAPPNDTPFPALKRALYLPLAARRRHGIPRPKLSAPDAGVGRVGASHTPAPPSTPHPPLCCDPASARFPRPTGLREGICRVCLSAGTVEALRKLPPKVTETWRGARSSRSRPWSARRLSWHSSMARGWTRGKTGSADWSLARCTRSWYRCGGP